MNKYVKLLNEKQKAYRSVSFELVPFTTPIINGEVSQSNLRLPIPTIALFIFSTLAFIILVIACFNLTNTTMALTGRRLKEIGIRKVVGSGRNQIVYQFLSEVVITISLAIIAGLLMAQVVVPSICRYVATSVWIERAEQIVWLLDGAHQYASLLGRYPRASPCFRTGPKLASPPQWVVE